MTRRAVERGQRLSKSAPTHQRQSLVHPTPPPLSLNSRDQTTLVAELRKQESGLVTSLSVGSPQPGCCSSGSVLSAPHPIYRCYFLLLTHNSPPPLPKKSFFKTLIDQQVTVELKNDIKITGVLKSVDQYLNIKLDDIGVHEEIKYPHLSAVKNVFIRGSVVRYVHLPSSAVDVTLLEDAARRGTCGFSFFYLGGGGLQGGEGGEQRFARNGPVFLLTDKNKKTEAANQAAKAK